MKVQLEFEVETLEELDKITQEIERIIPKYTIKMEIDSSELKQS